LIGRFVWAFLFHGTEGVFSSLGGGFRFRGISPVPSELPFFRRMRRKFIGFSALTFLFFVFFCAVFFPVSRVRGLHGGLMRGLKLFRVWAVANNPIAGLFPRDSLPASRQRQKPSPGGAFSWRPRVSGDPVDVFLRSSPICLFVIRHWSER